MVEQTIPAMRELQQQGKVRYIGITGLQLNSLCRIASCTALDSILSYCRYNLLMDDMDSILTPFAKQRGIGLINASPLHMGVLTAQGAPGWHPAPAEVKAAGRRIAIACSARGFRIEDVALRHCLKHTYASTTLIGMSTVDQVKRNVAALNRTVPRDLAAEIGEIASPVFNRCWHTGRPENSDVLQHAETCH